MATYEMRDGDNTVDIEITLIRKDGTNQPLLGSETIAFTFTNWLGATSLTKSGSISDQPNSKVKCTVTSADTTPLRGQVLRGAALVTLPSAASATYPTLPDDLLLAIY